MTIRTRAINATGLGLAGSDKEKMRDIRVFSESGTVQVWVEVVVSCPWQYQGQTETREILQYLTPEEAMAFSKAFERCAVQALKERA